MAFDFNSLTEEFQPINFVKEFIEKFEAHDAPWIKLIEEEVDEFYAEWDKLMGTDPSPKNEFERVGIMANVLKEYIDVMYVVHGAYIVANDESLQLPMKLATLVNHASSTVSEVFPGYMIREAFLEVHDSNMSKLGLDGKPVRRADGKVLKGPNYRAANIRQIVDPAPKTLN
jgi:hypothetical protein